MASEQPPVHRLMRYGTRRNAVYCGLKMPPLMTTKHKLTTCPRCLARIERDKIADLAPIA